MGVLVVGSRNSHGKWRIPIGTCISPSRLGDAPGTASFHGFIRGGLDLDCFPLEVTDSALSSLLCFLALDLLPASRLVSVVVVFGLRQTCSIFR